MAAGSANAAEMAQVQRMAPVCPPRRKCRCCRSGYKREIRRKCKEENLTQGRKEAKSQREND